MSWSDGQCPWSYRMQNVGMMPTCVYTPGLADIGAAPLKLTGENWDEILYGPTAAQAAPRSMGEMNVSAGGMDWTTIAIYAAAALVVVMLLSKGRR